MRSFARSLLAAVGIIAVLFGVPVALIAMAGWPLPTQMPDWDHVYWSARQGNIPAEFVIKTLACVVWLAWAQVAWALLWELAVNVPRAMRGRAGVASPLVAAPASRLARRLVTAAMVLTAIASTPASTAAAPALSSIRSTSGPGLMPDRAATTLIVNARDTTAANSTAPKAVWKVADGDTLWDIAEQSLRDGSQVDEILRSNPYLVASRPLRTGQQIELPEGAHIPADRSGGSPSHWSAKQPPTDEFGSGVQDDAVHVVTPGDTMWGIIEDHYGHVNRAIVLEVAAANGINDPSLIFPGQSISLPSHLALSDDASMATHRGDTYVVARGDTLWDIIETHYGHADADAVWRVAAANGLENPALIFPGQSITFPSDDAPATAPEVSDETVSPLPRADDAVHDEVPPRDDSPPAAVAVPTSSLPTAVDPTPATMPADSGSASATGPATGSVEARPGLEDGAETALPESDGSDDPAEVTDAGSWFEFDSRTVWASLPVGSLLLVGLVAMRRRLRTRRMAEMAAGEQVAFPPSTSAGTDLAVTRRARATERVATLNSLLRLLTPHSRANINPPAVRAVQAARDRVEVLLAEPAPLPPPGWTTVDGGHSWVHMTDAPLIAERQALLTPALITIGSTDDDDELLMDLETAGSVAIGGDHDTALGLVRSIVLELVSCPLGESMDVYLVGLDVDGVEHGDQVRTNATLDYVARAVRQTVERQAETGKSSIGATRAAYGDDGFSDAAVFVIDTTTVTESDRSLLDEIVSSSTAGTGAAVVLLGEHPGAREHLVVTPSGTTSWLGTELRVPQVTREAAAQAAVMLDDAADPAIERLMATATIADLAPDSGNADPVVPKLELGNTPTAGAEPEAHSARLGSHPDADGNAPEASTDEDDAPDGYTPPDYDVLVRVLDGMSIDGAQLTGPQVELLTLLTMFRPRRPNIDTLVSTLDPEMTIVGDEHRYIQKRMSKLRTSLGQGCDGEDLIPPNAGGRGQHARYGVSPRVMTDIELLEHRLNTAAELSTADALEVLVGGLDLLCGPPFRAPSGYDWAAPEGFTSRIANLVNSYAIRVMELAATSEAVELVYAAASAAFRVVEDPLASLPVGRAAHLYVDSFGDPALSDLVKSARRRALDYAASTDPEAATR